MKQNTIEENSNESTVIGLLSINSNLLDQAGFPARNLSDTGSDCIRALKAMSLDHQLSFREAVAENGYSPEQAETICSTCESAYHALIKDSAVARSPLDHLDALSHEIITGAARLQAVA